MRKIFAAPIAASFAIFGILGSMSSASAQADPLLGQLMVTGATYCPNGWLEANGQLVAVSQNAALYSLLGTTYGGDGQTSFGLPDLRGRGPIHYGSGPGLSPYVPGQAGGQESFTIGVNQMPAHSHAVMATNATADKGGPDNRYLGGGVGSDDAYSDGPANKQMAAGMIGSTGGNQPVTTRSPYLVMRWCIAIQGIYPPRP